MHIPDLLPLMRLGGTVIALSGFLLGVIALLIFARLIYKAVLSDGPEADRLALIIRAWRHQPPKKKRK